MLRGEVEPPIQTNYIATTATFKIAEFGTIILITNYTIIILILMFMEV